MAKKHGPCFHCGIRSTPHWRNGPELKPVLCNACGTRYRKRGIIGLEDYLPKHFQPKFLDNLQNFNSGQNLLLSGYVTDSGGEKPPLWNPTIPSRKRSQVVYVKITPMKRFRIQSPAEVLLFNNTNNFLPNNEIGLGCVLLKPDYTSATYI